MKHIPIILLGLLLGGCESLYDGDLSLLSQAADVAGEVEEATLGTAMKALPKYCQLPYSARSALRDRANARPEAEGHQIGIYCAGDGPLTLGE